MVAIVLPAILGSTKAMVAAEPETVALLAQRRAGCERNNGQRQTDADDLSGAEDKAVGTGVVVCPGGGYTHLSMEKEGSDVAKWLNSLGISAFVLKYRLGANGYQHPAPMEDGQRAIRLVRANAEKWHVDPNRIGMMGFSAGGHLTSTVGTHFDSGHPDDADLVERASCRPDFLVLIYPVISMTIPQTHSGSKKALLGANPDPELVKNLSNELQVTTETPPTFLVATNADTTVPAENSVQFYLALRKAKVPAELHIWEEGKHGFRIGAQ